MGWRDFRMPHEVREEVLQNLPLVQKDQKVQKENAEPLLNGHFVHTVPDVASEIVSFGPLVKENLTTVEQEFYDDLMSLLTGPKHGMSQEQAEVEAKSTLSRTRQVLQAQAAARDFDQDGYIKIFSTKLGHPVYICRDSHTAKKVPLKNIPVVTLHDIQTSNDLNEKDRLFMLEARIMFNPYSDMQ